MDRGFDQLMTPEGIAMLTAAMLFLLSFIFMGGMIARTLEQQKKAEKSKKKPD